MPVAPSFSTFEVVSEPYLKNGKDYIDVRNPQTNTVRSVRLYSDIEYEKQYKQKSVTFICNLKHARGFDNGPIVVIRNIKASDDPWLFSSKARYAEGIGWHFVSTDIVPFDAPPHFKYVLMSWEEFKLDDNNPKSPKELSNLILKKVQKKEFVSFRQQQ